MKAVLISLVLLGFSASALPTDLAIANHFPADAQKTKFDYLQDWFKAGTPVTFDQLRGATSGRCFYMNEKNTPRGDLLVGVEYNADGDVGPGFPADPLTQKMVSFYAPKDRPNYFDDRAGFDYNQTLESARTTKTFQPIQTSPVSSTIIGNNKKPWMTLDFASSQNFIVVKMTAQMKKEYPNWWTDAFLKANPGDVVCMCYFFKRLD